MKLVQTYITYRSSGQVNGGDTRVDSVEVRRLGSGLIELMLSGDGYLSRTRVRIPEDLARSLAHALLLAQDDMAQPVKLNT